MPTRFALRRLVKPFAYTAAAATSGVAVYVTFRPRPRQEQHIALKRDERGQIIPPKFPSIKSRAQQIAELKRNSSQSSDEVYDLLVIGGGATGTGIALDAASRGLKVALVDRDDFSSGTSSKSTKLVHGGVRYLEKAVWNLDYSQYELVREALRERRNFLYTAPHLSSSVPILLPIQKWWQMPYFWAGAKAYDLLAGSEGLESSYYMSSSKALEAFPLLKKDQLSSALVYYDGQHNDSRMNISLAMTAALYGVTTVNHLEVVGLQKDEYGKLCAAQVRDAIASRNGDGDEKEFTVHAKGIVNATGPFSDAILQMDEPQQKEMIAPSSGVHIVLPGHFSPKSIGLLDPATSDGRVIFFLPWQGNIIAGTTDKECSIERDPVADDQSIDFILKEVGKYIDPNVKLDRNDVLSVWSGIRPLVRDPNSKNTESLVRNHLVTVSKSGLLTCAGGKWTTYRQMAEDAVDEAIRVFQLKSRSIPRVDISGMNLGSDLQPLTPNQDIGDCQTHHIRLLGAHGYSKTLYLDLIQHFGLSADIARHLASNYGDRAWEVAAMHSESKTPQTTIDPSEGQQRLSPRYPFIENEIHYAVQNEYAQTATDFLARRTRLSFLDTRAALESLPRVIDVMGEELNWTPQRKELEWSQTVKFLGSMGLPQEMLSLTRQDVMDLKASQRLQGPLLQLAETAQNRWTEVSSTDHDEEDSHFHSPVPSEPILNLASRPSFAEPAFRSSTGIERRGTFLASSVKPEH